MSISPQKKSTIFLGKSKLNFWTKDEDFEQCAWPCFFDPDPYYYSIKLTHRLDRILSNPGNPKRIISDTREYPFGGSAGIRSVFSGKLGIAGWVTAGDNTAADAAEIDPKMGRPGFGTTVVSLLDDPTCLWYENPARNPLPVAMSSLNLTDITLFTKIESSADYWKNVNKSWEEFEMVIYCMDAV